MSKLTRESLTPQDMVMVNKKLCEFEKLELLELLAGKRKKRIESLRLEHINEVYGLIQKGLELI